MPNSDSQAPLPVVPVAQVLKNTSPRIHNERDVNMNQLNRSNPPDTPTPPPSGPTNNVICAPEAIPLLEKHQNALRHIRTLESHNTKLYEDNCRLVNVVNMLNDRLVLFGAPQNTQVLRLAEIQEKLRASETNWASVNRKYQELLQSISADSAHHHIALELQAIRDAYASLDREYRLLGDKYLRLKAVADANRVAQQPSQGPGKSIHLSPRILTQTKRIDLAPLPHLARGQVPVARTEFANTTQFRVHAHGQSHNDAGSPTSVMSAGSYQPYLDQKRNQRRHSSESVMVQPSLPSRTGPTPIATTWLAPLPTPPPSAPLHGGQISPTGFSVYTSMPSGPVPLPHNTHAIRDQRALSGLPAIPRSRHIGEQGVPEQAKLADHLRQRLGETTTTNSELYHGGNPAPALSPRPLKRSSSDLETDTPPEEHKKLQIREESDRPMIANAEAHQEDKVQSPVASTETHHERKLSEPSSDVRSYQDCVNLIFEKDADVENGVFCGLCLDRYEAKMVEEPPDVLVQPDFDFLLKHCMNMHPAVWDGLRHKA